VSGEASKDLCRIVVSLAVLQPDAFDLHANLDLEPRVVTEHGVLLWKRVLCLRMISGRVLAHEDFLFFFLFLSKEYVAPDQVAQVNDAKLLVIISMISLQDHFKTEPFILTIVASH